jgi:hypothetical protein
MTIIVGIIFLFSGDVRTLSHNYFGLPNSGDPNWEATIGIHGNDSAASCFSPFGRGELQYPIFLCTNGWNILILSVYINFRMKINFLGEQQLRLPCSLVHEGNKLLL